VPRLPDVTSLGDRPTPQPGGGLATYQVPNARFGLEDPGRALEGVGQAMGEVVQKFQERADTTRVEDAWNQYKNTALDMTVGDKGILNLKGGDAVNGNILQTAGSTLKAAKEQILGSLANDEQRRRFGERATVTDLQVKHQVLAHLSTEQLAYDKTVQAGSEAAANAQVNAVPQSLEVFQQARDTLMAQADAYLKSQGITDNSAKDDYKSKLVDGLWSTRIESLLYSQPLLADALLRANEKEIKNPQLKLQLQEKTRNASIAVSAGLEAQKAIDEVRSLPEQSSVKLAPGTRAKTLRELEVGLARDPGNTELMEAKYVIESQPEGGAQTTDLPNSRDIAAQMPLVLMRVEKAATRLYGPEVTNPDRAAFVRRMTTEVHAKISSDVEQLNAIERQAYGRLINAVAGTREAAPAPGGMTPVAAGAGGGDTQKITSHSQIMADPVLGRDYMRLNYQGQLAVDNMVAKNLKAEDKGDPVFYRELWNRVHLEPGDAQKIDFYRQITDPAVANRLSIEQINNLRQEIDRDATPGGRSIQQMIKFQSARVERSFATNINFTMQPGRAADATNRWTAIVGQKIDDLVKAGQADKVRSMFMVDTPDSVISDKYLQTFVNSTPAQGVAEQAAAVKAGQAPATPPAQMPATITDTAGAEVWFKTLPANVDRFTGPDGKVRMVPPSAKKPKPIRGAPVMNEEGKLVQPEGAK
jgi:hypothetical protein